MIYEGSYKIYFYDKLFQFPFFFNNIDSCRRVKFILKKNVQKIYFLSMRKVIPSLRFRTHAYVYPSNVFCKRKTSKYNATPKTVTINEHTAGSARSINIRSGCALCATPICFKLD